jgi:hypothetical protein
LKYIFKNYLSDEKHEKDLFLQKLDSIYRASFEGETYDIGHAGTAQDINRIFT